MEGQTPIAEPIASPIPPAVVPTPTPAPVVAPAPVVEPASTSNIFKNNGLSNALIFVLALAGTYFVSGILYFRSNIKTNNSIKNLQNQIDQLK